VAGAVLGISAMVMPAAAQNSGRRGMPKMFGPDAPNVGDTLPDVTIYNDKGDKIRIRAIKGKYRVIVFGCLT